MNNFVISMMNSYGYIGIFLLIMIENLFPPIPSEVILTLGGFMTTQNSCTMNLVGVILSSTLGSVVGAIVLYYVGYILNKDRLVKIINSKLGKILCLKIKDIEKSEKSFDKSGNLTVLYCRFVPIVRSLISIPAGMNKMKMGVFVLYTTIGSLIWNTVLIILGNLVGENYMFVANTFSKYSKFLLIIFIVYVLIKIIKKYRKV